MLVQIYIVNSFMLGIGQRVAVDIVCLQLHFPART